MGAGGDPMHEPYGLLQCSACVSVVADAARRRGGGVDQGPCAREGRYIPT